ncbi:MAG: cyclic nucleotide-binding domain-containing protein [Deltaproteobacteria bacterium]|nr:cyclic nucleotide-binding domain-containing protein [Deltaproteobacteria bacterium]MBI3294259.1 cyclic nucleotide-binding domain-containing protein [Deltaproteobacteria bacterium]
MTTLEPILREHPFFQGMEAENLACVTSCAQNIHQKDGFLFREKEPANHFYLIREGKLSLEVASRTGPLVIDTLDAGDVVGWSWLFPPYQWHFDARALEPLRAVALNGKCLRQKCETDTRLGFDLMRRFSRLLVERLQATRLRLVEAYEENRQ